VYWRTQWINLSLQAKLLERNRAALVRGPIRRRRGKSPSLKDRQTCRSAGLGAAGRHAALPTQPSRDRCANSFSLRYNTISVHPQGRFKADNGTALAAAVVAGLGIAWLPAHLIKGYLDSGALIQVMPRYLVPTAGMFVVRPPGQHSTRKVRVLTELLIEHFG
jgi:DNA-binding transcriptional LysR family regulator